MTTPRLRVWMVFTAVIIVACDAGEGENRGGPRVSAGQAQVVRFWEVYRRATRLRMEDSTEAAIAALHEALAIDSTHEDALYYLGNLQFGAGRLAEAESAWLQLVAVQPQSARGALQLGMLYACPDRAGFFRPRAARARFERALAINQEETGPQLRLGILAMIEGDDVAARARFDQVLLTHPESREARVFRAFIAWRSGHDSVAAHHLASAKSASPVATGGAPSPGEGDTRLGQRYWTPSMACPSLDRALAASHADTVAWQALFQSIAAGLP